MYWYYCLLAKRPYLIISGLAIFSLTCIILSFCLKSVPDFNDPTLGFETRDTEISRRLVAWSNLERTISSGKLSVNPNEMNPFGDFEMEPSRKARKRKLRKEQYRNRARKKNNKFKSKTNKKKKSFKLKDDWLAGSDLFHGNDLENESFPFRDTFASSQETIAYGRNTVYVDEELHRAKVNEKESKWVLLKKSILPSYSDSLYNWQQEPFCGNPSKDYAHFVVEKVGVNAAKSLFDLESIVAMCELEEQIASITSYKDYCQTEMTTDKCCKPWSIANYVNLSANKSCKTLTTEDLENVENLLLNCFDYFKDYRLNADCSELKNCEVPPECVEHDLVFNILYFLTDTNFIKDNETTFLKYSMIFVPIIQSEKILPLFYEWSKKDFVNDAVGVVAMDLGLEKELFNDLLLTDCWLVALGALFVLTAMWLYTSSMLVTFMTSIAVLFSLGLAYFVYVMVFEMDFFPYMNIMAIIVIVGIGADDAFIFMKIWETVLAERFTNPVQNTDNVLQKFECQSKDCLQNYLALTLEHAAVSMLVTSLTTAFAFFASYTSNLTAIKCFGIFAGTAVITNYLFMITWLPASISIKERLSSINKFIIKLKVQGLFFRFKKSIRKFCQLFESTVIKLIVSYSWFWLILFGVIGGFSLIVVLYKPGISLPTKTHFQLFSSQHPFELYNEQYKNEFWFEKNLMNIDYMKMPLRFVWGILPIDDGDYKDPLAYGNLHYDNTFNISTKESQIWLLEFCHNLRQQTFCEKTFGQLLPNCFIENFVTLMDRKCVDEMSEINRSPCCETSKFPFEPAVFDFCLPQIVSQLYATPREFFLPGVAGPKFEVTEKWFLFNESSVHRKAEATAYLDIPTPIVKALVISFDSNITFSTDYEAMKEFKDTVESWFVEELKTAPKELRNAFFISELKFFDIQDTLANGTILAIFFAMCTALIILLLVTLNVLISFYAVITICLAIFTTIAILIGLGWTLGILESVTVSTAIGLAVDFSLHFGLQYRKSPKGDRVASATFALERIIAPTAMAALTTCFAGLFMMASNILAYIQIGVFLNVIMVVSWLYSTFFLVSLLKVAGPEFGFMQFHYIKAKNRSTAKPKYYDRKPSNAVVSEQLLTSYSSAIGDMVNSETHELASLNSHSNINTISCNELESKAKVNSKS